MNSRRRRPVTTVMWLTPSPARSCMPGTQLEDPGLLPASFAEGRTMCNAGANQIICSHLDRLRLRGRDESATLDPCLQSAVTLPISTIAWHRIGNRAICSIWSPAFVDWAFRDCTARHGPWIATALSSIAAVVIVPVSLLTRFVTPSAATLAR